MKDIIMPKLGLTMEEGIITRWLKKEGEPVEKGEVLFEVETDKAINEVESNFTGKLGKILVEQSETAEILSVIGYLLDPGEEEPEEWPLPPKADKIKFEIGKAAQLDREKDELNISAVARALAEKNGIDLDNIKGSGPRGKIVKADVEAALNPPELERKQRISISPRARRLAEENAVPLDKINGSGPGGRIVEGDVQAYLSGTANSDISLKKRIIAERMTESFTSAPHFYLRADMEAQQLQEVRERLIPEIQEETGFRLTYTDLFVYLIAKLLGDHPLFAASWEDGKLIRAETPGIGLAMAVESGLVVPVLKPSDTKDLVGIVKKRMELLDKAKQDRLSLEELEGGTFTISNLGMYGIDSFSAIINPPQSAILAIGRIKNQVVPAEGEIKITPMVSMTLSLDHRVMDGVDGAKFLQALRDAVEMPNDYF